MLNKNNNMCYMRSRKTYDQLQISHQSTWIWRQQTSHRNINNIEKHAHQSNVKQKTLNRRQQIDTQLQLGITTICKINLHRGYKNQRLIIRMKLNFVRTTSCISRRKRNVQVHSRNIVQGNHPNIENSISTNCVSFYVRCFMRDNSDFPIRKQIYFNMITRKLSLRTWCVT